MFHLERYDRIVIILNDGNLYIYEDKDTRFDCVWEEFMEWDSQTKFKRCKHNVGPIFKTKLYDFTWLVHVTNWRKTFKLIVSKFLLAY